ncbi:MAG: carbonic anhydrase [Myxococcota bacterium]|nr:carbonic anhydrase [Myxococcota bacterium]
MTRRNDTGSTEFGFSRRAFLKTGALAALLPLGGASALAAGHESPQNAITPSAALDRLTAGNARYVAGKMKTQDFSATRAARAKSQHPVASILSCADSRVAPELAFDQGPGDLFVARVAGNVVTPGLLASLEYSVEFLGVPLLMVLGHTGCGAVGAAIQVVQEQAVLPGHLPELVAQIEPAVERAIKLPSGSLLANACEENVRGQVAGLKKASPIIAESYAQGKIDIVGAVYDLPTGQVKSV